MHATAPGRRCGPQGMVVAAGWRGSRSRLPQFKWTAPQRRRFPATRLEAYRDRTSDLSVTVTEESDSPHLAARFGHLRTLAARWDSAPYLQACLRLGQHTITPTAAI